MKIKAWHVLVVILLLSFYMGWLRIPGLTVPSTTTPSTQPSGEEIYYGTMQIKITESNYFDGSSETTSSASYVAYQGHLGPGTAGVAISASGTDFDLAKEAQGWIYMKIYPGTAHYPMVDAFIQANPRIKDYYWQDIDDDGLDDLIVKIWVGDIGQRGQALKPVLVLALPLIDVDVTDLTDDDPSDISSIGTSEVVKQITWKISGVSEKAGFVISRLYISTNETREGTDIKCEELSISGLGVDITYSAPVYTQDGPNAGYYSAWYIKLDDYRDWHNGVLVYRAPNKADALYITLNVRCTMESGDALYVQLNLEYVKPDGTTGTLTDQVVLSA